LDQNSRGEYQPSSRSAIMVYRKARGGKGEKKNFSKIKKKRGICGGSRQNCLKLAGAETNPFSG